MKQSLITKSIGNARELGSYITKDNKRIKDGILLRTAALDNVSREDIGLLINKYKLSTIIDFRMPYEVENAPDIEIEGVRNRQINIIDIDPNEEGMEYFGESFNLFALPPEKRLEVIKLATEKGFIGKKMYINFLQLESAKKGYKAFFKELLDLPKDRSILFHCTQGKDRTGLAAMLILAAMNVDEEIIIDDYMLTNLYNKALIEKQQMFLQSKGLQGKKLDNLMLAMDRVAPETMINVVEWLKKTYGSILDYIYKILEISDEEIASLKNKFLL